VWDAHTWALGPDIETDLLEGVRAAEAEAGPTAKDLVEFDEWAQETAAREYLCPADATLTLAELVDRQAAFFRAWPLEAGEMIARAMDELALRVRLVDAATPSEYEARADVLDRESRSQWEAIGFEQGKASCPCHDAVPSAFGHHA
jgi:hypothetical protein